MSVRHVLHIQTANANIGLIMHYLAFVYETSCAVASSKLFFIEIESVYPHANV